MTDTAKLLNWITAGDQEPRSPDDQKCGDHFIQEGLECHDGDAHRPTPGKNPYWQGGRKGSSDKNKGEKKKDSGGSESGKDNKNSGAKDSGKDSGKKEGDGKSRDKKEVTPQTKKRQDTQKEQGGTPEAFAQEQFDHYAGMMEQAYQERMGKPLEWNGKRVGELLEMVMRSTSREFSLDAGELGFQDPEVPYYGPLDNPQEPMRDSQKKGYKGRALWRPRTFESPTTTPRDGAGRSEHVPPAFKQIQDGLYQKVRELVGKGKPNSDTSAPAKPETSDKPEEQKPSREEAATAPELNWATQSEQDLLALHNSLPPLPQDQAKARPCGEGEDPEQGHCNPNIAPPAPRKAQPQPGPSDSAKFLRKMGGPATPAPEGVGLGPKTSDEGRKQRTIQHVQNMKKIDPADSKRNAWAISKMFGDAKVKQTDKGIAGASKPMDPKQAQLQYDDARHSLEQSGWKNTSEMGGRTTWSKGGAQVSLVSGKDPSGMSVNHFLVHTPKSAPAPKKGLFGSVDKLNWSF